jgi:hypothetical protein
VEGESLAAIQEMRPQSAGTVEAGAIGQRRRRVDLACPRRAPSADGIEVLEGETQRSIEA